MNRLKFFLLAAVLLCAVSARAQLAVSVSPVQVVGQKAVVQLKMQNDLADKIESARAVCFLLNVQDKMLGQSTKWVIGKSGLEPKGETKFNFVVSSRVPFTTTNLTAKVIFNRLVLASGPASDIKHEVTVTAGAK